MALHIPSFPPPTPSTAAHSSSTENSFPVDGGSYPVNARSYPVDARSYPVHARSYPVHAGSFPAHPGSYPVDGGSFPVHDGSFPLRCRSRCPCFATSYPDAYRRNHCPIDGKSTLHRRKIHAPSTPLITGSTPLLYPPKRLASPRLHLTLITVIVSPDSFFSFSLAFCPINFPFAPRHQQPYPTAILPHSPSRSIALYLYTSPSSSIHAVRASDSRFTSISLSLSQRTQTRSHTHTSYSWEK